MGMYYLIVIFLVLTTFSMGAYAAVGDNCTINANCSETSEVCDTSDTDLCVCAANYTSNPCVYDCRAPVNPTGYILTPSNGTLDGDMATVVCATGYEGTPSPEAVACTTSGWADPSGCSEVDCGSTPSPAGYIVNAASGTTYGQTATVTCDTDSGYTGSPDDITCEDGDWPALSGCSLSGGGGVDCGNPTASTGYIPGTPDTTAADGTATVSCDTASGYIGTAANITCQANGTWSAYFGCTVDCGDPTASAGYIPGTLDTTEMDGIATVSCDTDNGYTGTAANITCQSDGTWTDYSGCSASENGASDIRQAFIILIGSFVFVLVHM